jgi:transcriptional regulator with XRE-family HTH domain
LRQSSIMSSETQCRNLRIALAKQIRSIRVRRGISQEELAFRAGLHRTYISLVERSKKSLTVDSLARIAAALDVGPSRLLANAEKSCRAKDRR